LGKVIGAKHSNQPANIAEVDHAKKQIRTQILSLSNQQNPSDLARKQSELANRVGEFFTRSEIHTSANPQWAFFSSIAHEPNPLAGVPSNIEKFFPRIVDQSSGADHLVFSNNKLMREGKFGISEPVESRQHEVEIHELAGVFVPGVAFDRKGNRLGRGRGYYDRALEGYQGLKVGVCFSHQVLDLLPTSGNDVAMDFLITDLELISFDQAKGF
jgi:5-formyltetrahydrofolate cyclo-ligase